MRLVRRLDRAGRWLLLVLASLLPLLALWPHAPGWAGIDRLPPAVPALLALPALYLWACAWLAGRDRRAGPEAVAIPPDAGDLPAVAVQAAESPGPQVAVEAAPESQAEQAGAPDPCPGPAPEPAAAESPGPSEPGPGPEASADAGVEAGAACAPAVPASARPESPSDAGADLRTCHAEIRMATDEIARRTVALAGMLDACSQAMEAAVADLDALQDEERVAQKVLVTLRARLLALDHRNHALMRTALAGSGVADDPGALEKAVQAAETQVLHCHQLSERLGAAERGAVRHLESLRRIAELLSHHAQRGVRESQQLMVLTRKVGASLAAADAQLRTGNDRPVPPPAV